MKFTNLRIRKKYRSAAMLSAFGTALCLFGLVLFVSAFVSAGKAVSDARPMGEILTLEGNHAARPAYFEIDREPVKAAQTKDETYYLITDGNDYHLCGMTDESYARTMADYGKGDMRIEGVTKVIIDDNAREDAAAFLSDFFGRSITAENLDDYVGDVHLRAVELTRANMIKEIYVLSIAFGVPILLISLCFLSGGFSELSMYRKIRSADGVSAGTVDAEVNSPDSMWLECFGLYLTPSYIVGLSKGITALRYDRIKRLDFVRNDLGSNKKVVLKATADDGGEYILAEVLYSLWLEQEERRSIIHTCRQRNPDIENGAEKLQFRYPFYVNVGEEDADDPVTVHGRKAYEYTDSEIREELANDFYDSGIEWYFEDGNSVTDMTLEFDEEGYVIISALADRGRAQEIKEPLDRFIRGQLADGWGEGYEGFLYYRGDEAFTISFFRPEQ